MDTKSGQSRVREILPSLVAVFFEKSKEISVNGIVQSQEVRDLCKRNSCGYYGKNWTCPPAVAPLDTFKQKFRQFKSLLVVYQIYQVQSSFDWKGMMASSVQFKKQLQDMKESLDNELADDEFLILGMGSCDLCTPCSYVEKKPCRRPGEAIISLEACGVDVMRLMRDHGMKYYNGKNTITLVAGVLF